MVSESNKKCLYAIAYVPAYVVLILFIIKVSQSTPGSRPAPHPTPAWDNNGFMDESRPTNIEDVVPESGTPQDIANINVRTVMATLINMNDKLRTAIHVACEAAGYSTIDEAKNYIDTLDALHEAHVNYVRTTDEAVTAYTALEELTNMPADTGQVRANTRLQVSEVRNNDAIIAMDKMIKDNDEKKTTAEAYIKSPPAGAQSRSFLNRIFG